VVERLDLRGRDFISVQDYPAEELWQVLREALRLEKLGEKTEHILRSKSLAMIFQKPSTRTRLSFELAVKQLGGHITTLRWDEMQLGRGETVADTARTIEHYVDGIIARVLHHNQLEEFAKYASIPVINALSDCYHPCQALSDMLTIYKIKKSLEGLKLAWLGDGNNVCHSLLLTCAKLGVNMSVACPEGYEPKDTVVKISRRECEKSGSNIEVTSDPAEAAKSADVIYTDTFISMGKEAENEKRRQAFLPRYRVTSELFRNANEGCVFMHCLPAQRGQEVAEEVIDGPQSVVWFQAENRLHLQKGLLSLFI